MGIFGRDSCETKFLENVPVVAYVVSAAHAIAGNEEHAKRAAAKGTNSFITTVLTVAGGVVGGPPGAMAGAAVGSAIGIGAEHGIAEHINDKSVRGDVGSVTPERFAIEVPFAMVGAGLCSGTSAVVKDGLTNGAKGKIAFAAGQAVKGVFVDGPKAMVSKAINH